MTPNPNPDFPRPPEVPLRSPLDPRPITLEPHPLRNPFASCLAVFGDTRVLCCASVEDRPPPWLAGKGRGWVTAEYAMLPASTHSRRKRDIASLRQDGRAVEIQRLIGRSLRASIDLTALGERQIVVDCDVLQADGGTRTAAITGGFVALALACDRLVREGTLAQSPIRIPVAAISACVAPTETARRAGLATPSAAGAPLTILVDPDYAEDSAALGDANIVVTGAGDVVEFQLSAENGGRLLGRLVAEMMVAVEPALQRLFEAQKMALALSPMISGSAGGAS